MGTEKCENKSRSGLRQHYRSVFEGCPIRISGGTQVIITEFFLQFLAGPSGKYRKSNPIWSQPLSFQIMIHQHRDNLAFPIKKLHSLSPRANCTDRATAACRRSDCQLLQIEGATWSATEPYGRILGFLDRSRYFSIK
jgi:hypothetical protein